MLSVARWNDNTDYGHGSDEAHTTPDTTMRPRRPASATVIFQYRHAALCKPPPPVTSSKYFLMSQPSHGPPNEPK